MSELTLPVDLKDPQTGTVVARIEMGGAETKNGAVVASILLPKGDIINVRNVQGGTVDNPNLDLGAGSAEKRGNVVINWDVGNGLEVCDGRKTQGFSVNRNNNRRIESHLPHRFYQGALVPNGSGGWRHL